MELSFGEAKVVEVVVVRYVVFAFGELRGCLGEEDCEKELLEELLSFPSEEKGGDPLVVESRWC